jgi:hypothetical protein
MDLYRCYDVWIWKSRSTRICDTVSWFPTKDTMPLATSTDLILAGIQDILHALQHLSSSSPLAPLTDSHVAALRQLTTVLTNIVAPTELTTPEPAGAPISPLSVVLPPAPAPARPPNRQSSLRVPTSAPDPTPRTLRFAPLPSPHSTTTFATSTGPTGRRRRKSKRKQQPTPIPFKTVHPTKLRRLQAAKTKITPPTPAPALRATPKHHYGTRANKSSRPLQHVAATVKTLFSTTNPESPTYCHAALHGNAFNPDTGKLAEFLELSKCSQGTLWQQSNADEIGCLAQGHGTIKGTNTIFFIDPRQIPKGRRKVTYLRVVCAHRPEKETPSEYAGLSAATASSTQAMSALKPLASSTPSSCSTASYIYPQRPIHDWRPQGLLPRDADGTI